MTISICPNCKGLVKDKIHNCKAVPGDKRSAVEEKGAVAVKKETLQAKQTIPPKIIQPSGNQASPKSAVEQDTRFVKILSANLMDAGAIHSNFVLYNKQKRPALIFDREVFISRFIQNKNSTRKPTSQEDFKAIVYANGGPVPSRLETVLTKPDETGNWVCIIWEVKSELS